ncbi:VOC family protein [Pseudonocardia sp. RS11V-5]|uniref:VOC family protein n=1 Tax=Pseudonocardia terrae TaxID=2905831 RepID=UPI001E58DD34|nr:VOC family protein [Pseudonocardia terrae]MCE3550976.1 VOC family protein [Pseudonocardia terrae]
MLELDHLIAFLPGPPDPPDGLLLDAGTRHVGQGTRNRRIVFPRHYVELLWIDEPEAERASGPGFAARCARTAYPFGIVLRGTVPGHSPAPERGERHRRDPDDGGGPAGTGPPGPLAHPGRRAVAAAAARLGFAAGPDLIPGQ